MRFKFTIAGFLLALGFPLFSFTQPCNPDYFSVQYQSNAAAVLYASATTPSQDMVVVGRALQINGGFDYDGWVIKLSPRGTVLWSKRLMLPGFNSGEVTSIAVTSDSTYVVAARFANLKRRSTDYVIEVLDRATVLMMLDKYGNLVWLKFFRHYATYHTSINKLLKLQNGDLVLTVNVFSPGFSQTMVARTSGNGEPKWVSLLSSESHYPAISFIKETSSGTILLSGTAYNRSFTQGSYFFLSLDAQSGNKNWNKGYNIRNSVNTKTPSPESIQYIDEDHSGNLSVYTSFSDTGRLVLLPHSQKAAHFVFSPGGNLLKGFGYYNVRPGCRLVDASATDANGEQVLLLDDGNMGITIRTDGDGRVLAQTGYGNIDGNLAPSALRGDNRILFGGRGEVAMLGLVKTDADGGIPCMQTPVAIVAEDVSNALLPADIPLNVRPAALQLFENSGGGINQVAFSFGSNVTCQVSCCNNVVHYLPPQEYCNRDSYPLPNGYRVRQTGIYPIIYRTPGGCDSTVFYDISLLHTPQVRINGPLCLEGSDTLALTATSGFDTYYWNGISSRDSTFTVRQPGLYSVRVINRCGSASDTVEVHRNCEFPVYLPSAFTPNNDGLNDLFGYPAANKNRLLHLTIYNRWGQVVFQTRNAEKQWDGRLNQQLLPAGVYVYAVEVETLNKKRMMQRGTITLIR